jgi:predicted esterase
LVPVALSAIGALAVHGCAGGDAPSQLESEPGPGAGTQGTSSEAGSSHDGPGDASRNPVSNGDSATVTDSGVSGLADGATAVGSGVDAGGAPAPFACPGGTISAGLNTLTVGGTSRQFYVDLPASGAPKAVVFSWHGFGDTAPNFRSVLAFDPDAVPAVPAVIVTPVDTGILPPFGLDWDIIKGKPGDSNVDLPFFEAMLGCIEAQESIDPTRVYSFGFSAGAVMSNLIASRYSGVLAASIAESGAWMNDSAETALVALPLPWDWPALDAADRGNVLLTHGGPNDVTPVVSFLLSLENAAKAAVPFLLSAERTVVDCAHTQGHALDPDVTSTIMMQYLLAHQLGQPSPFAGGALPAGFPAPCTLHLPGGP